MWGDIEQGFLYCMDNYSSLYVHHIPLEYDDDTQGCIRLHI